MHNDTLVFAFIGTAAAKVARKIDVNSILVESNHEAIADLINNIRSLKPKRVLGLGDYNGRDQDKLRIETICNNKFRNQVLKENNLEIKPFLKPLNRSKYAKGLGNSWCNLVSLKIVNSKVADLEYCFIHVPKDFDIDGAVKEINDILMA
jgi:hypothetical protein